MMPFNNCIHLLLKRRPDAGFDPGIPLLIMLVVEYEPLQQVRGRLG